MVKLTAAALFACICAGPASANPPLEVSKDWSVADTLKQLEQELGEAMVAVDVDKLNQILADDWSMLGYAGKISTKKILLANLKSGKFKLEYFAIGSMDVSVLDNVAVVRGIVTEKSTSGGADSSGKFIWMDVFANRGDKWVIIRSQSGKVWFRYRARWPA
jgi:hypothetical protein